MCFGKFVMATWKSVQRRTPFWDLDAIGNQNGSRYTPFLFYDNTA